MTTLRVATFSVRFRPRALITGAVCAVLALALGVLAIGSGDYPMTPLDVLRTLAGGGTATDAFIVEQVRLPRVCTGLLAGAALALAGGLCQNLVRNPLGSPDVLGVTQGATTGALTGIVAFGGGGLAVAGGAVLGGLAAGVLVHALAWRHGLPIARLVLTGIGLAAILTGVNGYLLTSAQINEAAQAVQWITGSLDGRTWSDAVPLLIALAVLAPPVLAHRGPRTLELGDEAATALGTHVGRTRTLLLTAAVVLTAIACAATGPVAFVALTAPQLARRLSRSASLLPALCLGSALLTGADLLAQRMIPGRELPVGVLTGVLGGGYLIWLLANERRRS